MEPAPEPRSRTEFQREVSRSAARVPPDAKPLPSVSFEDPAGMRSPASISFQVPQRLPSPLSIWFQVRAEWPLISPNRCEGWMCRIAPLSVLPRAPAFQPGMLRWILRPWRIGLRHLLIAFHSRTDLRLLPEDCFQVLVSVRQPVDSRFVIWQAPSRPL